MCRRTTCETCSKPDFAGCGMHIEAVLGDVPKSERCSCRESHDAKVAPPREAKKGFSPFG